MSKHTFTDYLKLDILITNYSKLFNVKSYDKKDRRSEIEIMIIDALKDQLLEDLLILRRSAKLDNCNDMVDLEKIGDKNKSTFFYEVYRDNLLDKKNPDTIIQHHFHNIFGGSDTTNVFSYLNQILRVASAEHSKFIEAKKDHQYYVKKAISKITGIPTSILSLENRTVFDLKVKQFYKEHINKQFEVKEQIIPETKEKNTTSKADNISDFEETRLIFRLRRYDNTKDKNYVGLKQIKAYNISYLNYLNNKYFRGNKLNSHIFIEGYHGTGKTTLAYQIAFNISNNYCFYINLKNEDNKELTPKYKKEIQELIAKVNENDGTIILDNVNFSSYTSNIMMYYFEESSKLNLHLIFIATLEQHNSVYNLKSFTQMFFEKDWEIIERNNLYLELTSSVKNKPNRFIMLEHFLQTYLTYTKKNYLLSSIKGDPEKYDKILNYLDGEFQGILYLLKLAIDNQMISSLSQLKIQNAHDVIRKYYDKLIEECKEQTPKKDIVNFILLSSLNIYFRVEQTNYDKYFIADNPVIDGLIKEKYLYSVKDERVNKNYTIFFPNVVIPRYLSEYIFYKTNKSLYDLLIKKGNLNSLAFLSVSNVLNIIRYLKNQNRMDEFVKTSKILHNQAHFDYSNENNIPLQYLIFIISTYIEIDDKDGKYDKKNHFSKLVENLIFKGNTKFMVYMLSISPNETIYTWTNFLINSLRRYYKTHNRNLSKLKHSRSQDKQIKAHMKKQNGPDNLYGNLLLKLINATLSVLLQKDFIVYLNSTIDSILIKDHIIKKMEEFDGGYLWENYIKEYKKI